MLVDSTDISGDPFVVLGTPLTFSSLRDYLVPRLEAHAWRVTHPVPNPRAHITDDDVIFAERGTQCVSYWNMNLGAWAARSLRIEAERKSSGFDHASRGYTTVFAVARLECP